MEKKQKNLGIYIHIPFCASKCAYCNFYSLAGCDHLMPRYQTAVIRHIRESQPILEGYITDTVYFGGGTPSYYGADRIVGIFDALKKYGNVLIDSEVTVEANPDSITYQDLQKLHRAGVNRVSIGMQSANDGILKSLGRRHDFTKTEIAVENARKAGFDNISLDIIYGLPSQTREDWADTINKAAGLKPEHISCYGLKIEEGTPLYMYKDSPYIPDDDTQADMYLYAVDALNRLGYRQYEISNFALRGCQSKHNMKYWQCEEYMGFGPSAHSYLGKRRYSCVSSITEYTDNILSGGTVIDQQEEITMFESAGEYLMLGLRTTWGISAQEYIDNFHWGFDEIETVMKSYLKHGWAMRSGDRWNFTPQGFLISNVLIGEVLEAQTKQKMKTASPWERGGDDDDQMTMFGKKQDDIQLFNGIS